MKQPETRFFLTEHGVKVMDKTIRLAKRNRGSILALTFAVLLQQVQLNIMRNDLYHHIQEYHRTEGD